MVLGSNQIWSPWTVDDIHSKADLGRYRIRGMSTHQKVTHFDDLTFLSTGLTRFPLEGYKEQCNTRVELGGLNAENPLIIETPDLRYPFTISHGFGFLPTNALMTSATHPLEQAIFILGIRPRCGTNFLSNLIQLHPECGPPDPVWEDFLLAGSDVLAQYSDRVFQHWHQGWGISASTQADLDASLGAGLVSFLLKRSAGQRVITKTPSVANLDGFFRFFPGSKLLILVRDGRSIIESGIRAFGWNREAALHDVVDAAGIINRFVREHGESGSHHRLVRYEDLWSDTAKQLKELFSFLQLDPDNYDFQKAGKLPLRGSSDLVEQGEEVHWKPVERIGSFRPLERFEHWSPATHARYNHIAGKEMELLGYPCDQVSGPSWLFRLKNRPLDASWWFMERLRPLHKQLAKKGLSE